MNVPSIPPPLAHELPAHLRGLTTAERRALAIEFEVPNSLPKRWADGTARPHPLLAVQVARAVRALRHHGTVRQCPMCSDMDQVREMLLDHRLRWWWDWWVSWNTIGGDYFFSFVEEVASGVREATDEERETAIEWCTQEDADAS